ncbi:hypothetical protein [Nonomuraea rubra]|uniref:hypothetical protein n=1 Tax=Nonomuraea rubra TaxID=46180 RepID=UPI0034032A08
MLVAIVGTLWSKAMPRWLSITGIVYVIVSGGLPVETLGRVAVVIGYLLQMALVAAIGWFGLRAALGRRQLRRRWLRRRWLRRTAAISVRARLI